MCIPLFHSLRSTFRSWAERAPARVPCRRPVLEVLEDRSLPSAVTTIATLGDSLTASYSTQPWGAAGDRSWAQLLAAEGNSHLAIDNVAVAGATSADVLFGGQVATVAHLVATGAVDYATLIVGANDAFNSLPLIIQGNTIPFYLEVTVNIEASLTVLGAAGHVGLAVGNIPDIGQTPLVQSLLTTPAPKGFGVPSAQLPAVLTRITTAISLADTEIKSFAAKHHIPVIDLFGLGNVAAEAPTHPITVGGQPVHNLYSPDFFHPNTVAQGLLGDTVLTALTTYDPGLVVFILTDQQILDDAHIKHDLGGPALYFDVRPYVIFS
jgi:lysophospholipase L1-like esterase